MGTSPGLRTPIGGLMTWLESSLGRGAVDATGLQGRYDFKLTFRNAPSFQNDNDPGDTVFDALCLLGLRAEKATDDLDFVVVDSVRREPLPN